MSFEDSKKRGFDSVGSDSHEKKTSKELKMMSCTTTSLQLPKDALLCIAEYTGDFETIVHMADCDPLLADVLGEWKCSGCNEEIFLITPSGGADGDHHPKKLALGEYSMPFFCDTCKGKLCGKDGYDYHFCTVRRTCELCRKVECSDCGCPADWAPPEKYRDECKICRWDGGRYCSDCQGETFKCLKCTRITCQHHGGQPCKECGRKSCTDCSQCSFCRETNCPNCSETLACGICKKVSCNGDGCPSFAPEDPLCEDCESELLRLRQQSVNLPTEGEIYGHSDIDDY